MEVILSRALNVSQVGEYQLHGYRWEWAAMAVPRTVRKALLKRPIRLRFPTPDYNVTKPPERKLATVTVPKLIFAHRPKVRRPWCHRSSPEAFTSAGPGRPLQPLPRGLFAGYLQMCLSSKRIERWTIAGIATSTKTGYGSWKTSPADGWMLGRAMQPRLNLKVASDGNKHAGASRDWKKH
jgi:hypothetical protein